MAITNLAPTTELEAVNAMLSAIGEAPIADVDASTQADVVMAVNILRNTCREVQAMGWRFNTEFGLAIAPAVTEFEWTDPDSSTLDIDVFTPPSGMVSFKLTPLPGQILSTYNSMLDVELRPSKQYTEGTPPADVAVLVFYDRIRNRDGFPTGEREFLYIDPVWLFDYAHLPETARRYIVITAARRFIQEILGDALIASYKPQDEAIALRALAKEQGNKDVYTLLDHPDSARIFGFRPRMTGPFITRRLK